MKILWVPQISSLSNTGEILLNKDSNISVLTNLIGSDFCLNNDIYIAIEFSKDKCIVPDEMSNNFRIIFYDESRNFTNSYMERFAFNPDFFYLCKDKFGDFDVIFVNEPTKVIPLRKIFNNSKIVTYNHWLAFKNMPELELRQFEGMNSADICFVNSDYTKYEIQNHYNKYNLAISNIVKAQPTFNRNIKKIKLNAKNNFIYNHRLSSDKYYLNAYNCLIEICNELEKIIDKNNMPIFYFTNPSGKYFKLDKEYFKMVNLSNQEEYFSFLESDEICGHINTFFDSQGMWSMSTVDSAISGNICLLPYKFGYAEIFDKNYFGYCNERQDMVNKIYNLVYNKTYSMSLYDNSSVEMNSYNYVGKKMDNEIRRLFE